jgi:hypothetical protein
MGQIRGTAIVGTLAYLREQFGDEASRRVLDTLPSPQRIAIADGGPGLLESGWYDCVVLSDLTRAADRLYGHGDLKLAREIGRAQAFLDTSRFFKWLLRLTSPETLFTRAASVWRNYHNVGVYVVEHVDARRARLRIEDWDSADPVMCRRIEGWIERALELTLGMNAAPTIREVAHQHRDPSVSPHLFCRFEADWK